MLFVVLANMFSLLVASLVVLYVAYPHRGEKVPGVPWVGNALEKTVAAAPVIHEEIDLLQMR